VDVIQEEDCYRGSAEEATIEGGACEEENGVECDDGGEKEEERAQETAGAREFQFVGDAGGKE
jgi:hypothetical protein